MHNHKLFYFLFFLSYFFSIDLDSHGFSHDAYIHPRNFKISHNISIVYIQNQNFSECPYEIHIISYDFNKKKYNYKPAGFVEKSTSNCYIKLGVNIDSKYDICCSPIQAFMLYDTMQWVPAYSLKIGDKLFVTNTCWKTVKHLELIIAPIELYSISVRDTHNFLIGEDGVLTHNSIPISVMLSFSIEFGKGFVAGTTCTSYWGPACFGVGLLVGGALVIKYYYSKPKATYDIKAISKEIDNDEPYKGTISLNDNANNSLDKTQSNNSKPNNSSNNNPKKPDDPEKPNFDFKNLPEKLGPSSLAIKEMIDKAEKAKDKISNITGYIADQCYKLKDKYDNMTEVFTKTRFGEILSQLSEKVKGTDRYQIKKYLVDKFDGAKEYLKKIGLEAKNYFYLDKLHKDHLEVFENSGKFRGVWNLDSTENLAKTAKASLENRNIDI